VSKTIRPTTIHVTRSIKKQGEREQSDGESEVIAVHEFATAPATASVTYPIKLSKNYQTAGVTIGVTVPCYAEEINAALDKATEIAVIRLKDEMPKLKSLLDRMANGA